MQTVKRECAWCGRIFEADARNNHKNVLCSEECRMRYKQAYRKLYRQSTQGFKHPHKEETYIAKPTQAEKDRREAHQADRSIWTADYAQRQKRRTLELIGRIEQ